MLQTLTASSKRPSFLTMRLLRVIAMRRRGKFPLCAWVVLAVSASTVRRLGAWEPWETWLGADGMSLNHLHWSLTSTGKSLVKIAQLQKGDADISQSGVQKN